MPQAPYQTDRVGMLIYHVIALQPHMIEKFSYNDLVRAIWCIDKNVECESICRAYRRDKSKLEAYIHWDGEAKKKNLL